MILDGFWESASWLTGSLFGLNFIYNVSLLLLLCLFVGHIGSTTKRLGDSFLPMSCCLAVGLRLVMVDGLQLLALGQ